jgi:hypothetical protein
MAAGPTVAALTADARQLGWSFGERGNSIRALFDGLVTMCQAEIAYYNAGRRRSKLWSRLLRMAAVVLGTLGLMAPLVPAGFAARNWAPWGYVLLALAGGALAANRLFTTTANHHRYVTAELELQQVLTSYQLQWSALLAGMDERPDIAELTRAFALLQAFNQALHHVTLAETQEWGDHTARELERLADHLSGKGRPEVTRLSKEA